MELKGQVAIITGAGSGIGKSTALLFHKEGARLVLTDNNEEAGTALAKEINRNKGEAVFLPADSSLPGDSRKSVELALQRFGKLDIAVNNAGIPGAHAPVGEYKTEEWDRVISVNLSGIFYGMRYQIPAMLPYNKGSIINIASIFGSVGYSKSAAYVAAKHGVVGLTKSAAIEYSSRGIKINAVGPGFIKTPLLEGLEEDTLNSLGNLHPIGRLGKPEEVAQMILWLAGERSSFSTGSFYPVDGGYLAR